MNLRDYQVKMLADIQQAYREGAYAPLLVSPMGSGKSTLVSYMISKTKKRTLILTHRSEIMHQISAQLKTPHGFLSPEYMEDFTHPVQVGTMQTVSRRLSRLPDFEWVISDEAHISACATWSQIINHYKDAWHLGLSATPIRGDQRPLSAHFDRLIEGPGIQELTEMGYLAPLRTFAPQIPVGKIRKVAGEFVMSEAALQFDRPTITGSAIESYRKYADGKRALVFCCSIAHADNVAKEFMAAGYMALNVDGSMSKTMRDYRIRDFRSGRLQVLTNCDLLGCGFDCPEIEVGIMLRPTMSEALYLQQAGRILRPAWNKTEAILLDHANNTMRHGLVTDKREWTLEGRPKKTRNQSLISVKTCKICFYAVKTGTVSCPNCWHVFEPEPREIPQVDGELIEIERAAVRRSRRKEQGQAQSMEQLVALGRQRGYKNPYGWAYNIIRSRGHRRTG